jgi:hypothetical protein
VDLASLHSDDLLRLREYQAERARREEERLVEAALAKRPEERSETEWACIAYSETGTRPACHHPR